MAGEVTQASGEKVSSGTAARHVGDPPQQPVMLGMGVSGLTQPCPLYSRESLGTL